MVMDGPLRARVKLSLGSFHLDAAFDVGVGEVLAVVGPSGAGKSSGLAAIAGLLGLDSGRVSLGDEVWSDTDSGTDWPPYRRRVGFVHQDYALFPHLSVLGNVLYGARARGGSRNASQTRAREWLDRLGLRALAGQPIAALSGGQRQRVALARALASGAGALLLDEPFGSLDVSTRAAVRRELGEFLGEAQLPTVFVTHDPTDALTLADRIAILEEGKVSQLGPCDELLARPQTSFVTDLFGLNFYRGDMEAGEGLREVRVGRVTFHVLSKGNPGPVMLAFPPSAVTLSLDKPAGSAQNTFQGIVQETYPLPEKMRVVLDCGVTVAADVVREAASSLGLAHWQRIWISIKATAIQVYS